MSLTCITLLVSDVDHHSYAHLPTYTFFGDIQDFQVFLRFFSFLTLENCSKVSMDNTVMSIITSFRDFSSAPHSLIVTFWVLYTVYTMYRVQYTSVCMSDS